MTFVDVGRDKKPDFINLAHAMRVEYKGRYRDSSSGKPEVHVNIHYGSYEDDYPAWFIISDKQWNAIRKKLSE